MARKKYLAWLTFVLIVWFIALTACRLGGQKEGAGAEATVTAVAREVMATLTAQAPAPTPTPPSPTNTPLPETGGERVHWTEATGKPQFAPGNDLGFFIWVEEPGIVHLRCVTKGLGRVFSGIIVGDGAIRDVVRTRQELGDVTIRPEINQVDFMWTTAGGPDGLDFVFKGTNLTFKLRLDGQDAPQVVYLGSTNRTISSLPLTIYR